MTNCVELVINKNQRIVTLSLAGTSIFRQSVQADSFSD